MPSEPVFFHLGLDYSSLSGLQKPGSLKRAENILFEREGIQELRPFFDAINTTAVGSIHSIRAWRNKVIIGDTDKLRGNSGTGDFTSLWTAGASTPWQFKPYKEFLAGSNGTNFILVDDDLNIYPAQVDAPITSPAGATGAGGLPNGSYKLYVSFFITWPNGHTYETGLSPVGADVNVTSDIITWSNIPVSTYAAYYGTAPTIYRNLYRGPGSTGSLTEIFYVATIADNSTTGYSDNVSDATLQTGFLCTVADALPFTIPKYFEWNYGRIFGIHPTYYNRLYYSEVAIGETAIANELFMPLGMLLENWDDIRVAGFDHVDPQAVIGYGSYLYIALKQTWIRKQGNDPDTWAYRKTYATKGIGAPMTVDRLPQGIIGMSNPEYGEPALCVFNGQNSEAIASPKLDYIFRTDLNIDQIAQCRGSRVGNHYCLMYPSVGETVPNRMLMLDIRRPQDPRIANWTDLNGVCIDTDSQSTKIYIGGSDGYVRTKAATGTCDVLVETHDLVGGSPQVVHNQKTWTSIKYALDSGGDNVTMQIYIDDVLMKWPDGATTKTITGTGEMTQVINSLPQNWKGYKMRIVLTGTGMDTFELYSPWNLDFTV
jgi:hypothetical protein